MRKRQSPTHWPLALQLAIAFGLVTALALGGSGLLLLQRSTASMLAERSATLLTWGRAAADLSVEYWAEPNQLTLSFYRFHQQSGIRPVLVDRSGRVIAEITHPSALVGTTLTHPEVLSALSGQPLTGTRQLDGGEWVLYAALPVIKQEQAVGAVLVAADITAVRRSQQEQLQQLLVVAGLMELLAVSIGILIARQLTRPLVRFSRGVSRIAHGELEARVEPEGSRELLNLGYSFNQMATELGRLDQQRRAFVADASHELRTPVTAIRALAEPLIADRTGEIALYKEHLTDIVQECDRAGRLVERLLELARMDRRSEARRQTAPVAEPVDLRQVAEEVVGALEPLAQSRGVRLVLAQGGALIAPADPYLIETILGNLVENGLKYTPAGGSVRVDLAQAGESAILTVTDTGIGIPPEEQSQIFERFYRVDKARSRQTGGAGLGLAIAAEAAALLGGQISLTSEPGRGSQFRFTLPV